MTKRQVVSLSITVTGFAYVVLFLVLFPMDSMRFDGHETYFLFLFLPLVALGGLERWINKRT